MATMPKETVDRIIAGEFKDDTPVVLIIKYQNGFDGGDAYGVIWEGQPLDMYKASPFVNDPQVYWSK
jgi:hypothetical protein